MTTAAKKRVVGRPAVKGSRVEGTEKRPRRVPVSGYRDVLTVRGQDPDYSYRWVKDTSEKASRILKFLNGGWEFVLSDSGVEVGDDQVYKTENVGAIVRVPAGVGGETLEYLYLMRIKKEWYEEDQAAKQAEVQKTEDALRKDIGKTPNEDDVYGSVRID